MKWELDITDKSLYDELKSALGGIEICMNIYFRVSVIELKSALGGIEITKMVQYDSNVRALKSALGGIEITEREYSNISEY